MRFKAPTFIIDTADGALNLEWVEDGGRFSLFIDENPKDSCWTFCTTMNNDSEHGCGDLAALASHEVFSMLKKIGALVSEE